MYESPINFIYHDILPKIEKRQGEMIIKACMDLGVDVNEKELVKALRYDREQYKKGYADAKAELVRCEECKWCEPKFIDFTGDPFWICNNWVAQVDADGFCYEAERREDAEIH